MSENSYVSIRNGTIASVLAGVILYFVPNARTYASSFFSWVWSGVMWVWEALIASYPLSLPGWAWMVFCIFLLANLAIIYFAVKGMFEASEPEFEVYIEDTIHGAVWRWDWVKNRISNIWCFCPRCDATLVYSDNSPRWGYMEVQTTSFICENCNNSVIASIDGGKKSYAIGAVEREIGRRIRTGEFKKNQQ